MSCASLEKGEKKMSAWIQYPDFSELETLKLEVCEYARLKCEQGAPKEAAERIQELIEDIRRAVQDLQAIPDDPTLAEKEPDDLEHIRALRTPGPRRLWKKLPSEDVLLDKLEGALIARAAGCLLGAPVEGETVEGMRAWADYTGKQFPPVDYWEQVRSPEVRNTYGTYRHAYQKHEMETAPVDDDLVYTQLALLILEEYGLDFTTEDVGRAWMKYLPFACTAEEVTLKNLHEGMSARKAAEYRNPYRQWIGAAIRSDGFGWAAAGAPERAAETAWRDAVLSHRRNGVYGEMLLAAAQSAAFAVEDPLDAMRIALTEIPAESLLHQDIEWALSHCEEVGDCYEARRLVDERFAGMHAVHTNNNLCLIVFGLALGRNDPVRGISQTVAMGLDCDCTAASVGSVLGAVYGKKVIPPYLYERFHDIMETYLIGQRPFSITDTARRYLKLLRETYRRLGEEE